MKNKNSKPEILVKLKMRKIYKFLLFVVTLLIIMVMALAFIYINRSDNVLDSDIEVNGTLSINYVDGKRFNVTKNNQIKFSITNSSAETSYYHINFSKVRGNGTYKLLLDGEIVLEGILKSTDEITTDYISIDANMTKLYTLEITNSEENNSLNGLINIRMQNKHITTFANTILKNNPFKEESLTRVGYEAATTEEGLIKSSDDIGNSYYFRGSISNNYVLINNLYFRIVRINGDETVRLVLDGITNNVASYYTNTNFNYKDSTIRTTLNAWFQDNLREYTSYIANAKFCSDISNDNAGNSLAASRVLTNKIPTLNCLGESINDSIGLLTVDEVILAGAAPHGTNQSYYLYNSNINNPWFTMSSAKGSDTFINFFTIDINGNLRSDIDGSLYRGVRPVINLIKNVEVTGSGTYNDPYKIVKN